MNWDSYFLEICKSVALKSSCFSRQIGAILVKDNSIISTGYNGPARGIPHCGIDRTVKDSELQKLIIASGLPPKDFTQACPRKVLGYQSGTHTHLCHAQHAEENCVSNAARNGVSTLGSTLYLNEIIPCRNCFSTLINAGVSEIVCIGLIWYDSYTEFIKQNSSISIRVFVEG